MKEDLNKKKILQDLQALFREKNFIYLIKLTYSSDETEVKINSHLEQCKEYFYIYGFNKESKNREVSIFFNQDILGLVSNLKNDILEIIDFIDDNENEIKDISNYFDTVIAIELYFHFQYKNKYLNSNLLKLYGGPTDIIDLLNKESDLEKEVKEYITKDLILNLEKYPLKLSYIFYDYDDLEMYLRKENTDFSNKYLKYYLYLKELTKRIEEEFYEYYKGLVKTNKDTKGFLYYEKELQLNPNNLLIQIINIIIVCAIYTTTYYYMITKIEELIAYNSRKKEDYVGGHVIFFIITILLEKKNLLEINLSDYNFKVEELKEDTLIYLDFRVLDLELDIRREEIVSVIKYDEYKKSLVSEEQYKCLSNYFRKHDFCFCISFIYPMEKFNKDEDFKKIWSLLKTYLKGKEYLYIYGYNKIEKRVEIRLFYNYYKIEEVKKLLSTILVKYEFSFLRPFEECLLVALDNHVEYKKEFNDSVYGGSKELIELLPELNITEDYSKKSLYRRLLYEIEKSRMALKKVKDYKEFLEFLYQEDTKFALRYMRYYSELYKIGAYFVPLTKEEDGVKWMKNILLRFEYEKVINYHYIIIQIVNIILVGIIEKEGFGMTLLALECFMLNYLKIRLIPIGEMGWFIYIFVSAFLEKFDFIKFDIKLDI